MNVNLEDHGKTMRARVAAGGTMVGAGASALYVASSTDHAAVYTALSLVGGCLTLAGALLLARVLASSSRPWRRRAEDAWQEWMRAEMRRAVESYDVRMALRERQRERRRAFGRALAPYLSALVGTFVIWRSFYLPSDGCSDWSASCTARQHCEPSGSARCRREAETSRGAADARARRAQEWLGSGWAVLQPLAAGFGLALDVGTIVDRSPALGPRQYVCQ